MKWNFFTSSKRSLNEVARVARHIAQGDFSQRLSIDIQEKLGGLAFAINNMADSLEKQFSEIKTEKQQLMTILDGMVEGVLVTNDEGKIVLVNPALQSLLDLGESPMAKTILECCRNEALHDLVRHVLESSRVDEREITLQRGGGEIFLIVHSAPISTPDAFRGSVSVFYDVTRLRKLELMRKEFVANVSHELKTPLTNILGYAETLAHGALSDGDSARRFVEKIENNAIQLKNLVEDILKLSEIESGRIEMKKMPAVVAETIESIQNSFEETLNKKKLVFRNEVSKSLTISVDPPALRQIIVNLLDNAIKYTPEGGIITVTSRQEDKAVRIGISDTGIGISETDLPHVFERFYRADKARSRQMGGTGLGLAIVKHLVQAHGGEVGVESEVGRGSRFTFIIPMTA